MLKNINKENIRTFIFIFIWIMLWFLSSYLVYKENDLAGPLWAYPGLFIFSVLIIPFIFFNKSLEKNELKKINLHFMSFLFPAAVLLIIIISKFSDFSGVKEIGFYLIFLFVYIILLGISFVLLKININNNLRNIVLITIYSIVSFSSYPAFIVSYLLISKLLRS